jgi:hypothetical protein
MAIRFVHFTKRLVKRVLAGRGYRLVRTSPLPVSTQDPLQAVTLAATHRPVVLLVAPRRIRGLHWFPCDHRHPFVAGLVAYHKEGVRRYEPSPLRAFYDEYQPPNAASSLGLSDGEAPELAAWPPQAQAWPWNRNPPEDCLARHEETERDEARQHGIRFRNGDGSKFFGPISPTIGQLQLDRLIAVYRSIQAHGWRRHDGKGGDAAGRLLVEEGGNWCIQLWTGQHRVAAAVAAGLTAIPVRVEGVPIRRSEVDRWPQVVAGRIRREAALAVFDRVLAGQSFRLPPRAVGALRERRGL